MITRCAHSFLQDIDEFIIPVKHMRWRDMITEVEAANERKNKGAKTKVQRVSGERDRER